MASKSLASFRRGEAPGWRCRGSGIGILLWTFAAHPFELVKGD